MPDERTPSPPDRKGKPHPMQAVEWDGKGVIRFRANPIVRYLLDEAGAKGLDLNHLARVSERMGWTREDHEHFAQLIGYSISGWGELSYVTDRAWGIAQERREALLARHPTDPALTTKATQPTVDDAEEETLP